MTDTYKEIERLFDRSYEDDLSDDEMYQLEDDAEALINECGWDRVYNAAFDYLKKNCTTPEEVLNFAHLWWMYGWHEHQLSEPYAFLGYFYFRVGMRAGEFDTQGILDSLSVSTLCKAGYQAADLYEDPYYCPEEDPCLLKAVDEYNHG